MENECSVIARLEEQLKTKSSLLQATSGIVACREKEIEDLKSKITHLRGVSKEADDLRKELKSLQEKFNALKYYGRDIEVDALKREVNHLMDYIDELHKHIHFQKLIELESDYCFIRHQRYEIK